MCEQMLACIKHQDQKGVKWEVNIAEGFSAIQRFLGLLRRHEATGKLGSSIICSLTTLQLTAFFILFTNYIEFFKNKKSNL